MERKIVFTERENQLLNHYKNKLLINFKNIPTKIDINEYSKKELTVLYKKIDGYIEEECSLGSFDEVWVFVYISIKEGIEKELDRREKGSFILGTPGSGKGYSAKNNY